MSKAWDRMTPLERRLALPGTVGFGFWCPVQHGPRTLREQLDELNRARDRVKRELNR